MTPRERAEVLCKAIIGTADKYDDAETLTVIESAIVAAIAETQAVTDIHAIAERAADRDRMVEEWAKEHDRAESMHAALATLRKEFTGDRCQPAPHECERCKFVVLIENALSAPARHVNQCDGCQVGRPVDANGNHRMGDGAYPDLMRCQRERYVAPARRHVAFGSRGVADNIDAFQQGYDDAGELWSKLAQRAELNRSAPPAPAQPATAERYREALTELAIDHWNSTGYCRRCQVHAGHSADCSIVVARKALAESVISSNRQTVAIEKATRALRWVKDCKLDLDEGNATPLTVVVNDALAALDAVRGGK